MFSRLILKPLKRNDPTTLQLNYLYVTDQGFPWPLVHYTQEIQFHSDGIDIFKQQYDFAVSRAIWN